METFDVSREEPMPPEGEEKTRSIMENILAFMVNKALH